MSALLLMILKNIQGLDEQQQRAQEDIILSEKTAFLVKRGKNVQEEIPKTVKMMDITLDTRSLHAHHAQKSFPNMEKSAVQ